MFKNKNKLSLVLLLLAALSFALVLTGGEFLHSQVHHHQTKASHDECSFSLLQRQSSIILSAFLLTAVYQAILCLVKASLCIFSQPPFSLPQLRAPPVSLL